MHSLAFSVILLTSFALAADPTVELRRVPNHGLSPSAAVDETGAIHLIYFTGDPQHGDIGYVHTDDAENKHFSQPLRVNTDRNSAVILGGVRGPHLALGQRDRTHVLWNGSDQAKPRSPGGGPPLLYARINLERTAFEPQRNLLTASEGLDGGADLVATSVWPVDVPVIHVAWHGYKLRGPSSAEAARRVWLSTSLDDGDHFGQEAAIDLDSRGACGCCALSILADDKNPMMPHVLYRIAEQITHRDMLLIAPFDFKGHTMEHFTAGKCVMSTSCARGSWLAWESVDRIELGNLDRKIPVRSINGDNPKHPSIAINRARNILLAWTEKTTWGKGGSLVWQICDKDGQPLPTLAGRADDLPAWDNPAAVTLKDGRFVIFY